MNKIPVIALFGKSGAGKDYYQKWLVQTFPGLNPIISCTTRPPREGEQDKVDYYFLSEEEFIVKVANLEMLEATVFKGWGYGTLIEALKKDTINVGVFNPEGIECLLADSRLEVLPIYIYADDKVRLIRALNREAHPNCAEICRRYEADERDFRNIDFEYYTFNNTNEPSEGIKKQSFGFFIELLSKRINL